MQNTQGKLVVRVKCFDNAVAQRTGIKGKLTYKVHNEFIASYLTDGKVVWRMNSRLVFPLVVPSYVRRMFNAIAEESGLCLK